MKFISQAAARKHVQNPFVNAKIPLFKKKKKKNVHKLVTVNKKKGNFVVIF